MNSQDFKLKAKFNLKTYYWNLFVVGIILIAIMTSSAALVGLVLTGPAMVGVNQYRLHIARTNTEDTNLLVAGFKGKVINHIITFVLM